MFGSRKDDEKMAKRRVWPWGRRDEQGQSEETVEQPHGSAEAESLPLKKKPESPSEVNVDIDVSKSSDGGEHPADSAPAQMPAGSEGQGTKLGLFARMRQKFEKHSDSESEAVSDNSGTAAPVDEKTEQETFNKVETEVKIASVDNLPDAPKQFEHAAEDKKAETDKVPSATAKEVVSPKPERPAEKAPTFVDTASAGNETTVTTVETEKHHPRAHPEGKPSDETVDSVASKKESSVAVAADKAIPSPESSVVTEPEVEAEQPEPESEKGGFFARMRKGLNKTRSVLVEGVTELFIGKKEIDDDLLEELETQLLVADVGVEATSEIIEKLTQRVKYRELDDADALIEALKTELKTILEPADKPLVISEQKKPYVILVVGVNGVGKTTTIGKLASRLQRQNKSVMLAAGDTFRAAAVEQLQVWGERNRIPVIAQHTGADSASVIYDAFEAAKARGADVLIADTAGRLHNKEHLMEELKKVKRVLGKLDDSAPHEVLLVLDAGTGQNALSQAKLFHESVGLTGMALTKLDGTAKGGVIFALSRQMQLPIRFLGVGEQIDDLRPFAASEFVNALFDRSK